MGAQAKKGGGSRKGAQTERAQIKKGCADGERE